MKYSLCVLLVLLGIAAVVYSAGVLRDRELPGTASARAAEKQDEKPEVTDTGGPPPLVIDKSAPLLLEEPPEKDPWAVPDGPVADNTACYCCHINYEEEPLAVCHAKANVGCVKCHGQSYDHRDDEDNVTPPDIMYWPEKIQSSCRECHETHDAPAREVIARWQERCRTKTDPGKIVCTDCHGQHRLKLRTVRWDKKTRKLIIRGKREPVKTAPDLTKPDKPPKKVSGERRGPDPQMQ